MELSKHLQQVVEVQPGVAGNWFNITIKQLQVYHHSAKYSSMQ